VPAIDLNRVATFVRVAEARSFSKASRSLGLPVSSVSRAVAHLEDELGVRLLHRTTRTLSLTEGGERFFQRMQAVLSEAEEATHELSGFASEPRGVVRITAPPALGGERFPPLIARITERYPGVVLELVLTNRRVDLVAEGIDLAIRAGVLEDSSLVARKVAVSELAVYGAPAYLERRGRPRKPSDLLQHACLTYGSRDGKIPWRLAGPGGEQTLAVSGPIVSDDMRFLRDAAIAGIGLALVPADICVDAVSAGRLARVLPRYRLPGGGVYLVWPSQKLVPARVVAVRDMFLEGLTAIYV
jgi:DNA-binding transcriptional LysR family regulator